MSVLDVLLRYYPSLLKGLWVTLELFALASLIGIGAGILLGALGAKYAKSAGRTVQIVSFTIAGIPLLVLLYWFFYPFQSIFHISINAFTTAVIVLAVINVATVAELIRNVLADFPQQYVTVGQMSGLSSRDIFRRIQFPMIFRQIIPTLLVTQVYLFQATLFASLIGVQEIFRVAQNINAVIYKPIEIYTALAIFFIITLAPINYAAYALKQRFTRDISG